MDPTRFDRLSRALAATGPRRGVLALLAALPVAGVLLTSGRLSLEAAALATTRKRKKANKKDKDKKGKSRSKGKGKDQQRTTAQAEGCWRAGACIVKKGANVSQCDLAGYTAPPSLNCTGCNLSRANLNGADLRGATFTKANLSGACLIDADFTGATFANTTNLYGATFCRTIMPDGSINNSGCQGGTTCCSTCLASGASCGVGISGSCCGGICDGGTCQSCDVCPTCAYTTVQAAIADGSGPSTIRVCAGTYGAILVSRNLTIVGAGDGPNAASNTILDAAGSGRVVLVKVGVIATLRGLRVTGGVAVRGTGGVAGGGPNGGGIVNDGTLTLLECTVTENTADGFGGGIVTGGSLTLIGCTVSGNTCGLEGGGIAVSVASVMLTGCQITGNTAARGGGIGNLGRGTSTIASTTITGNTATVANAGGGIFNEPGGTVTLQAGASVTGNFSPAGTPNNCVGTISGGTCGP
jgi:uncharacterized protein YjbI with pentapeptide repeats